MMRTKLSRLIGIGGVALLAGGAFAQSVTSPTAPASPEGDLYKQASSLSPQETVTQSREYLNKMQQTQSKVSSLQEVARKKKDLIKLNCVNDKLTQLRGQISVATKSFDDLNQAVGRNDNDGRVHEYTRMAILYQKSVVLGTEAENCVGEDASYVGTTKVDVEVDPSIPDDDPTEPEIPIPVIVRPPAASPFA